jgi:hypothetical protein
MSAQIVLGVQEGALALRRGASGSLRPDEREGTDHDKNPDERQSGTDQGATGTPRHCRVRARRGCRGSIG